MPATHPDWLLWQLADSAFPTGGFAHSGGLEAAWQLGEAGSVARFALESLDQAASSAIPVVVAAWDAPERFAEWDALTDGFLSNHVANRASRTQGAALLSTAASSFAAEPIVSLRAECRKSGAFQHLAPVFGVVARTVGIDRTGAARLFLFLSLRAVVSSAVRLGAVGPMESQALQHRLAPAAESALARGLRREPGDVAQSSPLLDLWQGHHDRLYSRLFSS